VLVLLRNRPARKRLSRPGIPRARAAGIWRRISKDAVLRFVVYICRVMFMAFARRSSRQTIALLAALMEKPRTWQHGYELSKETGLKSGTLYPILMRLSDQHLLDSRWKEADRPGRPPRHEYRLTAAGLAVAREQIGVPMDSESGFTAIKAGAR
jgi:PadR family transcriptional regulator, regulatory protein PadR